MAPRIQNKVQKASVFINEVIKDFMLFLYVKLTKEAKNVILIILK